MEWIDRLNQSLDFLEANLDNKINYDEAARIACCSTFHYQRMFSYIANVPLAEYIRRRKMTLAAVDLQSGNGKIIDIALKYGYDSPTAFNRAFQMIHGISPRAARASGVSLKAFPRITFNITIKGDVEMNYKIEKKDAFRIVGVKEHYELNLEENLAQVPLFWQRTIQNGTVPLLISMMNMEPKGILGVSTCMNGRDFDYYIAVATDTAAPQGMFAYEVPQCTWAIFECTGALPHAIQQLQKRIVSEWLPSSGFEYADAPDIEVYFEGDQQADDYQCQVWLPIIKKSDAGCDG
ncbi:AraC family transcriptional regulator [bacterium]|nr:MAG: AraC family transcriptional regulator [bacterium]